MKYVIVANGPFLPKSIILEASEGAKIVALDGAFHPLVHLGIRPAIVIGDFDSVHARADLDVMFIHRPDQNFTDLQKALQFCLQEKATAIHIVCALGGRLDHDKAAIYALEQAYTSHCPIYLHSTYQSAFIACNETIIIRGRPNDHCGLFGAPLGTMSVKNGGLAYGEVEPYVLSDKQYSTSNYLVGDEAVVDIMGKVLIIHPPMLRAQRAFSAKTRKEQLMDLLNEMGE